jgi:hypothetical protein
LKTYISFEKILSTPSFLGDSKPSVPCPRFAACKRTAISWIETRCRQNYRTTFLAHSSTFHGYDLSRLCERGGTWRRKVVTSKRGGKQWQTTPKNLLRMQRTRAIPVAWLGSGSCPNCSEGWILLLLIIIIIIILFLLIYCRYKQKGVVSVYFTGL